MIFDKFVGFATEEEMLAESTKMVENNTLWGGKSCSWQIVDLTQL